MEKHEAGSDASEIQQKMQNHGSDESIEEKVLNSEQPPQQPLERKTLSNSNTTNQIYRYSCEECGKTFSQSLPFSKHKRIHEHKEDNSYPRDHCDTTVSEMAQLLKHSCQVCGGTFSEAQLLESHQCINAEKKDEPLRERFMNYHNQDGRPRSRVKINQRGEKCLYM